MLVSAVDGSARRESIQSLPRLPAPRRASRRRLRSRPHATSPRKTAPSNATVANSRITTGAAGATRRRTPRADERQQSGRTRGAALRQRARRTVPKSPVEYARRRATACNGPVALPYVRIARFVNTRSGSWNGGGRLWGVVEGRRRRAQALTVAAIDGHPFGPISFTGDRWALPDVRLLSPILPSKVVARRQELRDHARRWAARPRRRRR